MTPTNKVIGIIGGAGPYAGIDLLQKITRQTNVKTDQEHPTVINWSQPSQIADRTEYLEGKILTNPGFAIAQQAKKLSEIGAVVAAIPCNTAHASPIFNCIMAELAEYPIKFLNMIEEVGQALLRRNAGMGSIGILSTTGTYKHNIYPVVLNKLGFETIVPPPDMQAEIIHPAIYHPHFGIKSTGGSPKAKENLIMGAKWLTEAGAKAIILGCTEIPIVLHHSDARQIGVPFIDPTQILANALLNAISPSADSPLP